MEKVYFGSKDEGFTCFSLSEEMFVCRTWPGSTQSQIALKTSQQLTLEECDSVFSSEEKGVAVRRVPDTGVTAKEYIAALRSCPDVRFAGHVLIDENAQAPVIYTENVYIKFSDDADKSACLNVVAEHKLTVHRVLPYAKNAFFLKMPEGSGRRVFSAALALLKRDDVDYCHPEILREKRDSAIDSRQWHLKKAAFKSSHTTWLSPGVDRAHRISRGKDVVIAVIDRGFDIDHPDFENTPDEDTKKVVSPVNNPGGRALSFNPRPQNKSDRHGTSVAGVACANGRYQASGVAPDASLMPIRNPELLGSLLEADALFWAVDRGADVICCAWVAPQQNWYKPSRLRNHMPPRMPSMPASTRHAIDYAIRNGRKGKGCIVLFAAGNGNQLITPGSYQAYENVLAVAAYTSDGMRAPYSNFGEAVFCASPGHGGFQGVPRGLWTTKDSPGTYRGEGVRTTLTTANVADFYDNAFSGTSAACAGAAGVAALILSVNPGLTRAEVVKILQSSCSKTSSIAFGDSTIDMPASRAWSGYGYLSADTAVMLARKRRPKVANVEELAESVELAASAKPRLEAVFFGKKTEAAFYYEESPALLAVRTRLHPLASAKSCIDSEIDMLRGCTVVMSDEAVGLTVFEVEEGRLPMLKESLRELPEVRFAGNVMVAQGTTQPAIYTENVFVKFLDALDDAACMAIILNAKLTVKRKVPYADNAYFLGLEEGAGQRVFSVARDLLQRDEVEYSHPEIIFQMALHTIHNNQWQLKTTTVAYDYDVDQNANVEAAHRLSTGHGATIAVIDDGVDLDHPDFAERGKIVQARDGNGLHDPRPKSRMQSHGTSVAGVACASGRHRSSGVAPDARLVGFRMWFAFSGASPGSVDSIDAFYHAANAGADVINCSWGPGGGDWTDPADPSHARAWPLTADRALALKYAATKGRNGKGCIIVFAAGNSNYNCDTNGHASSEYVLAVAACDDQGRRSRYSCFGKSVFCAFPSNNTRDPNEWDAAHLTKGVWTTTLSPNTLRAPEDSYVPFTPENADQYYTPSFGGTSSAAPGVAGVVALIVSANPSLSREEVMDIIKRSCDKIGDPETEGDLARYDADGHSQGFGYGRVNAEQAVILARRARFDSTQPHDQRVHSRQDEEVM